MNEHDQPAAGSLRRGARIIAVALLALALYVVVARYDDLPYTFFRMQDGWIVAFYGIVLLGWSLVGHQPLAWPIRWPQRQATVAAAALVLTLALWAGTYLVMANYPLTRDEHMVVFDMGVFRGGSLAAPLAPAWQPFATALVPAFLLDLPHHAALVSAYMPGNAALRTGFALVADPALMNPALAAVGLLALFSVVRRVFAGDGETQAVVLLLYATSAQVLVTAMTAYAMTGHLALNMIWLALFMRGTRSAHLLALAVGFVATGLHQVIFHPLFVAPFLVWLVRRGEWRTALFYALGYAAIGLFWSAYPHLVAAAATAPLLPGAAPEIASAPAAFFTGRILPLLLHHDPATLVIMALNLLRFAAWQNLALLPLALLAMPLTRAHDGIAQPLYHGILLTLIAMVVLLPFQGHGWGYRYMHGFIGSFTLLAGFGWQRLAAERAAARSLMWVGSLATLAGALPFLLATTHAFVLPYARVDAAIGRIPSDLVIIDTEKVAFAVDEVRNAANLAARPIRLASSGLRPADLPTLCGRGSVAFVSRPAMQALGLGVGHIAGSPHLDALRAAVPSSCRVVPVTFR